MNLIKEYNKAALERLNISYDEVLRNPRKVLLNLLNKYRFSNTIDISTICYKLPLNRIRHIINLFLSRDFLFSKLYQIEFPESVTEDTLFDWDFLALAHDLAYIYETDKFSSEINTIEDLYNKLNINTFLFCRDNDLFYTASTYTNYFRYKCKKFGVCDHGIVAGALLYNDYERAENGLKQLSIFNLAYVIASHNIYIADISDVDLYKEYALAQLIPNSPNFMRLPTKHNKYAYYYLCLCMLDILEPINAFDLREEKKQFDLLSDLSYEINNYGMIITSSCSSHIEYILKRIHDISVWMNVEMIVSHKKIELRINKVYS